MMHDVLCATHFRPSFSTDFVYMFRDRRESAFFFPLFERIGAL